LVIEECFVVATTLELFLHDAGMDTKFHDYVQLSQEKEHLWLLAYGIGTMKLCICWNFEVLSTKLFQLFQKFLEV
jgi:hypothetical protein